MIGRWLLNKTKQSEAVAWVEGLYAGDDWACPTTNGGR